MNDLPPSKRPGVYGLAFTPSPDADHLYARIYRPWSDGRFLYYGKGVHGGLLGRGPAGTLEVFERSASTWPISLTPMLRTCWASFAAFAEGVLLEAHGPTPWNHIVRGFGNRNPGFHRGSQQVARWDLLHVGRRHHSQRSMDFGAGGALAALDLARSARSVDLPVRRASGSNSPDPTWRHRRPKASTVKGPLDPHSRQAMSCWETA